MQRTYNRYEIYGALAEICYNGIIISELLFKMVGKAGDDIKIWCGLENDTPEASSDNKAAYFLGFIKKNKKYQK